MRNQDRQPTRFLQTRSPKCLYDLGAGSLLWLSLSQTFFFSKSENADVRDAFLASYGPNKSENRFTKVKMDRQADAILQQYFSDNLAEIESWFNVISPAKHSLGELKDELKTLSAKNWKDIHG